MEEKEGVNSFSVTVKKGDEAGESVYPSQFSGSTHGVVAVVVTPAVPVSVGGSEVKKRGRPRKYAPDGSLNMALSPMPISASIPLTGDFSAWKHNAGRQMESFKKKNKSEFENPGGRGVFPVGGNFTPHVITVNAGVDVSMKIISFAQQGCRTICVLAANGSVSNVTLRQANSSGGTLTYEGRFEILSLTGSFMPTEDGVTKSRSGGLSVSLAGPDGRVLGGGLAGMLVAAGPVQVVIGSFLHGNQLEQKAKKPRYEPTAPTFTLTPANPISEGAACSGPKPHMNSSVSFHGDNMNFGHGQKKNPGPENNNNISFADPESTEQSPSNCEVSY